MCPRPTELAHAGGPEPRVILGNIGETRQPPFKVGLQASPSASRGLCVWADTRACSEGWTEDKARAG